jgi:hypothetical protein
MIAGSAEILAKRHEAAAVDPFQVKALALTYKLTQAQVRGLLMKCGRNWLEFDRAASLLRNE